MNSEKRKKAFTIDQKVAIIRSVESGQSKADVAREHGLLSSSVSTIWKNRDTFIRAYEKNMPQNKKLRGSVRGDVDEALLKWFTIQRNSNVTITGPMLKVKAEELARLLDDSEFVCSGGWLDRFKARHNICFGKVSGEAAEVSDKATREWLENCGQKFAGNILTKTFSIQTKLGYSSNLLRTKRSSSKARGASAESRLTESRSLFAL